MGSESVKILNRLIYWRKGKYMSIEISSMIKIYASIAQKNLDFTQANMVDNSDIRISENDIENILSIQDNQVAPLDLVLKTENPILPANESTTNDLENKQFTEGIENRGFQVLDNAGQGDCVFLSLSRLIWGTEKCHL